jgi:hypothetical protein
MKISKLIFTLVFLLTGLEIIMAQYDYPDENDTTNKKEHKKNGKEKTGGLNSESRVFFGGNLGLSFGSYTYIELAPTIGYKLTERFWSGMGPEYLYFSRPDLGYKTSIYGFRNFASFAVLKDINEVIHINIGSIFLYGENEVLSIRPLMYNTIGSFYYQGDRSWYDLILGGFGIRMPVGNRSGISILILFRLNESAAMLYSNPEIRLSVDI